MKKNILTLLFSLFTIGSLFAFYYIGGFVDYPMHMSIRKNIVNHPEFIPSKNIVKLGSAGYQNAVSDIFWLDAIQYIGSNAVESEYKRYLYAMLNLITDVNPDFTHPYLIGELLLPTENQRYEKFEEKETKKFTEQSISLGIKGLKNTCDPVKLKLIRNEYDLKKLWTSKDYKNPCIEPNIPYYLGYIYYWNLFDGTKSSEYYRITSANEKAPSGSRIMAAIMQGKSGDRQKSILMFLSLAESLGTKNTKICSDFSSYLGALLYKGFQEKRLMDSNFIRQVEDVRKEIIGKLGEKNTNYSIADESSCSNYLNKAVREINMAYIEEADKRYFNDKGKHAADPKELLSSGYIDFEPQDYQKDKDQHIIYYFNKDTGHWDNKMSEL